MGNIPSMFTIPLEYPRIEIIYLSIGRGGFLLIMVSKNTTYDMIATVLLNHREIDHDFNANIKIPRSTVQLDTRMHPSKIHRLSK